MLNLYEIEQFVLFAETGSLTKAAELLHLSAPTLSRSMQNMEEAFGVSLFNRTKNRLTLNATGQQAAIYCKTLLSTASDTLQKVRDFDLSLHTITVRSCAPAPLWKLLPLLNTLYPSMTISSSVSDMDTILTSIQNQDFDILILPGKTDLLPENAQTFFMDEHLSVCVRKDHELSDRTSVTLNDLNGYNFLLRSELGFWDSMCRQHMPSSRFLVQTDEYEFNELVHTSSLPSFITNVTLEQNTVPEGRIAIPVTDADANVSFYLAVKEKARYATLFSSI